jgi:hypothetical protein
LVQHLLRHDCIIPSNISRLIPSIPDFGSDPTLSNSTYALPLHDVHRVSGLRVYSKIGRGALGSANATVKQSRCPKKAVASHIDSVAIKLVSKLGMGIHSCLGPLLVESPPLSGFSFFTRRNNLLRIRDSRISRFLLGLVYIALCLLLTARTQLLKHRLRQFTSVHRAFSHRNTFCILAWHVEMCGRYQLNYVNRQSW